MASYSCRAFSFSRPVRRAVISRFFGVSVGETNSTTWVSYPTLSSFATRRPSVSTSLSRARRIPWRVMPSRSGAWKRSSSSRWQQGTQAMASAPARIPRPSAMSVAVSQACRESTSDGDSGV